MRLLTSIPALVLALSSTALSLPTILSPVPITTVKGPKQEGSYIVRLSDDADQVSVIQSLLSKLSLGSDAITYSYSPSFINGFSGKFSPAALPIIQSLPGVEAIHEDAIWSINTLQTDATWGLNRINKKGHADGTDPKALTYKYNYPESGGSGVDVYIVDTGINVKHETFGGRAKLGWFVPEFGSANDGNGHGTHCAGTAVGALHGVAKKADVFAVKVLSDEGSGYTSGIIAGIDWVIARAKKAQRPSVVSLSLGGLGDDALDAAMEKAIKAGLHVVVAAGNESAPSELFSPARVKSVTTVGAWTINESTATFSNWGLVVDTCAPGQDVTSSWIGPNNNEVNTISGTSMATPHVAGVYALYLTMTEYKDLAPEELAKRVAARADTGDLRCPGVVQIPSA